MPIGINVRRQGTSEFLRDAKDPRQTSEPELAPTAWVTVPEPTTLEVVVWGLLKGPAQYTLYAYSWEQPKPPSATPSGTPSNSAQ